MSEPTIHATPAPTSYEQRIRERYGVGVKNMTPYSFSDDPWIICPYYTGRDKGPLHDGTGYVLSFFTQGYAWKHIFTTVQPNDDRACTNYRVIRLSEYARPR